MARRLQIRRVELSDANVFVARYHSHHAPSQGHKFSLGCFEDDRLCGVVIASLPRGRHLDNGRQLELVRVCTDRTLHAASMLIAAATRAVFALGYGRVFSDVLEGEEGASYRAAGWTLLTDEHGEPKKCGHPQGSLGWDSRQRTEPLAGLLALRPKHVGGYKHRWFRDNPELQAEAA
jgi:hypothetical protein